jgi:hypothetical protein
MYVRKLPPLVSGTDVDPEPDLSLSNINSKKNLNVYCFVTSL